MLWTGQEKYLLYVLKPNKKLNIEAMWMKRKRGITSCTKWNPIYFLAINCSIFDLRFDIAQSVIHWGFDMNEKKQKEWSFHVRSKAKVLHQLPLRSSIYHDIKRNNVALNNLSWLQLQYVIGPIAMDDIANRYIRDCLNPSYRNQDTDREDKDHENSLLTFSHLQTEDALEKEM